MRIASGSIEARKQLRLVELDVHAVQAAREHLPVVINLLPLGDADREHGLCTFQPLVLGHEEGVVAVILCLGTEQGHTAVVEDVQCRREVRKAPHGYSRSFAGFPPTVD